MAKVHIFQIEKYKDFLESGVLKTQIFGIIKQLSKISTDDIHLIFNTSKPKSNKKLLSEVNVNETIFCSSIKFFYVRAFLFLAKIVKNSNHDPSIVYSRNVYSGLMVTILKKFLNLKHIYDTRADIVSEHIYRPSKDFWFIRFTKKIILSSIEKFI